MLGGILYKPSDQWCFLTCLEHTFSNMQMSWKLRDDNTLARATKIYSVKIKTKSEDTSNKEILYQLQKYIKMFLEMCFSQAN